VTQTLAEAEMHGLAFARDLGCASLDALRSVAAADVLAAAERHRMRGGVVVDGWILGESPARTFAGGRESRIPLIIGTNAREASYAGSESSLRELISARYGTLAARALDLYGSEATGEPVDPALGDEGARYLTDTTFRSPSSLVAEWHSGAGAPVWLYLFSRVPKGREVVGAAHSSELAYAFGEMRDPPKGVEFGVEDAQVSWQIGRYWANFARTGDPNAAGNRSWPNYDGSRRAYLELRTGEGVARDNLREPFYELFRAYFVSQMAEGKSLDVPPAGRK
jgi:para-nitrobenzyl esterase